MATERIQRRNATRNLLRRWGGTIADIERLERERRALLRWAEDAQGGSMVRCASTGRGADDPSAGGDAGRRAGELPQGICAARYGTAGRMANDPSAGGDAGQGAIDPSAGTSAGQKADEPPQDIRTALSRTAAREAADRAEMYAAQARRIDGEIADRLRLRNDVEALVRRLTPVQERTIARRYIGGHSWRHIAYELHYDEGHVRKIESQAVDWIGDQLANPGK